MHLIANHNKLSKGTSDSRVSPRNFIYLKTNKS